MPFVLTAEAARDPKREAQIVDYYRSGMTLKQIGKVYKISAERVRQVLARYQKREGIRLDRKYSVTATIRWSCSKCGTIRYSSTYKITAKMCIKCRRRYPVTAFSNEKIESWIIQRRQGITWGSIAKKEGLKPYSYSTIPYAIFAYLRREGRLVEVQALWRGYSTRWLARQFPEDAEILISSKSDGRTLRKQNSSLIKIEKLTERGLLGSVAPYYD